MTTYIKFNVIHIILAALIVAALLSYSLSLTNRSSKQLYYGFEDFLGPLSDLSTLLLYVFLTIVITASMHVYRFNSFAVMVFLLIIAIKYVIPQYFDYIYVQNFYDAGGHMLRGAYVTITGYSDPRIDAYFDLQPGFFWWSAILINTVFGPQTSLRSEVFVFFIKWFNFVVIPLYVPILVLLFRRLGLSLADSFAGCALFMLQSLSRYHYSAQAFSWALYWLLLAICIKVFAGMGDRQLTLVLTSVLTSIVFIHQGTTFFTLITLVSMYLSLTLPFISLGGKEIDGRVKRYMLFSALFLAFLWFTYLMYLTIYTFGNFLSTLRGVIEVLMKEGIGGVYVKATTRSYEVWSSVVVMKSFYMISTTILLLITLLISTFMRRDKLSRTLLVYAASFVMSIGLIALALGGAGYVERVHEALLPLMSSSLILIGKSKRIYNRSHYNIIYMIFLSIIGVAGGVLYFAGWNFQSISYSEWISRYYVTDFGPNKSGIYTDLCMLPQYFLHFKGLSNNCLYAERAHDNIQAVYYYLGDVETIEVIRNNLLQILSTIYSSPTFLIHGI